MRKLYAIREDIQAVLNPREVIGHDPQGFAILDHINEEEVEMSSDEIRTELTALEIEFDDKLENCLAYIKNLKAEETALAEEIRRLTARKKAVQNKQDSVKEYTLSEIEATERMGITAGPHKARIAKSQDSVVVDDEHAVPDRFVEIITKVKKADILRHFKATGEILPGIDIETDRVHLRVS